MQLNKTTLSYIFQACIGLGVLLSLINFFDFRSLWLDEAMLALNIVNKPLAELLQPLDYDQVAPIGLLIVEKFFASIFQNTDWSLRIFPMLLYFASVYLFYRLSFITLRNKNFAQFATAFYALSYYMIRYSSEVKQYMADVTFTLLILLSTLAVVKNRNTSNLLKYALVGIISIWFSNVSIILLFTTGLYFIFKTYTEKKKYLNTTLVIGSWGVSFIVYFILFIHNHPTENYMLEYWENMGAFLPTDILSAEFYSSIYYKIEALFALLGYNWLSICFLPLFILGLFFLFKTKRELFYLFIFPLFLHLVLSYFKLYPFATRLTLYFFPILTLTITYSIYSVFLYVKPKRQYLVYILLFCVLASNIALAIARGLPTDREEIKEPLTYLNSQLKPDELLYVYYGAVPSFIFYEDHYDEISKTKSEHIIYGREYNKNWPAYQKDIPKADKPIWVLFSHIYWIPNEDRQYEDGYIVNLFEKSGFEITDKKSYEGCALYRMSPL